jgi:hypothetical protein
MKIKAPIAATILTSLVVFVGDALCKEKEKAPYQAGTYISSTKVNDGSYSTASCGSFGCSGSAYSAAHNVHFVRTEAGVYGIESPTSGAATFLNAMANNGVSPTLHKAWFMDQLNEGDTVLFSAVCNNHNYCRISVPNPDKPEKVIMTNGFFRPALAKTNATSFCGKGKLSAELEIKVCASKVTVLPVATPAPVAPVTQSAVAPVAVPVMQSAVAPVAAPVATPVAVVSVVQWQGLPASTDGSSESVVVAAARNRKHKACLKLAADNPNMELTCDN